MIFVIFYLRITDLIIETNLSVFIFLMIPHSPIFLVPRFILSHGEHYIKVEGEHTLRNR